MLRVMIEIWPYGLESEKRLLSQGLIIWNTGENKDSPNKGDYEFITGLDPLEIADENKKVGKVKDHVRLDGPLKLLYKCLKEMYGEEK